MEMPTKLKCLLLAVDGVSAVCEAELPGNENEGAKEDLGRRGNNRSRRGIGGHEVP